MASIPLQSNILGANPIPNVKEDFLAGFSKVKKEQKPKGLKAFEDKGMTVDDMLKKGLITTSEAMDRGLVNYTTATDEQMKPSYQMEAPKAPLQDSLVGKGLRALSKGPPAVNIPEKIATSVLTPIETGLSNVGSGFKSFIEGGQQELETRKQVRQGETDIKISQTIDELASEGYSEDQIMEVFAELDKEGFFKDKPGVLEGMSNVFYGGLAERTQKYSDLMKSTDSPISVGLQGVGHLAGGIGTTIATPIYGAGKTADIATGEIVSQGFRDLSRTKFGQGVGELAGSVAGEYGEFEKAYPETGRNLRAIGNIASIAPIPLIPKGVKSIEPQIKKGVGIITPDLKKTASSLKSKADMGFRQQAEEIALPSLRDMGARDKGKIAGDVIETKPGIFTKEEIVRSPQEALAIEEVSRLIKEGKVKKGASEIKNVNAIESEIANLSKTLDTDMKDIVHKPMSKQEVEAMFDDIAKNLDENPVLGELKNTTDRVIAQLRKNLNKEFYSASDLIDLRKRFDADIRKFKGDLPFSPERETVFSTILRDFRQGLNNRASEMVPDANVRQMLDRQSALYIARDTIESRWAKQANSSIGRILSSIQKTTGIPRTEIIELSTALGLLGAGSLAPIIAPVTGAIALGALAKAGIRRILSPQNKLKLSNMLKSIDEAIKKNPNDKDLIRAKKIFSNPNQDGRIIASVLSDSDTGSIPKSGINKQKTPDSLETGVLTKKKTGIQKKKGIVTPDNSENTPIAEKKGISAKTEKNGVKPSPQVKPVEKTVIKPTEKKVETNITRNEAIEKGFSDSAKSRWDKGDFTMKERGEATKYLKSNYKGKEYTIDGKKYKVDAIDNRNEQIRLVDSEGNIIRVKTNKLPEVKVTDKDIFDYYNGRIQKGYKTMVSPQKTVKPTAKKESATMGDMETKKLIEPKFTREQATKYMEDNIQKIMKDVRLGKITKEEGKVQMKELQNDMKYLRMGITPEKLKVGKEAILKGVTDKLFKK